MVERIWLSRVAQLMVGRKKREKNVHARWFYYFFPIILSRGVLLHPLVNLL
jgi:hypothetical protein